MYKNVVPATQTETLKVLASALKKVLPPELLQEVIDHCDPLAAFFECGRCRKMVDVVVAPDGGGIGICRECDKRVPSSPAPQYENFAEAAEANIGKGFCSKCGWLGDLCKCVAPLETTDSPEDLAQLFHEIYEQLAPQFGYETRTESAKPWAEVPEKNRKLMTAVCSAVFDKLQRELTQAREELFEAKNKLANLAV